MGNINQKLSLRHQTIRELERVRTCVSACKYLLCLRISAEATHLVKLVKATNCFWVLKMQIGRLLPWTPQPALISPVADDRSICFSLFVTIQLNKDLFERGLNFDIFSLRQTDYKIPFIYKMDRETIKEARGGRRARKADQGNLGGWQSISLLSIWHWWSWKINDQLI